MGKSQSRCSRISRCIVRPARLPTLKRRRRSGERDETRRLRPILKSEARRAIRQQPVSRAQHELTDSTQGESPCEYETQFDSCFPSAPVVGTGGRWDERARGVVVAAAVVVRHPRKGGAPRGARLTRHPAGSSHSYCQLPTLRPSRSSLALDFG